MVLISDELDELDLQLLDALQRNARSTFTELGSVVGLKAPAVHDRVKRLEQRGYIRGYAAQLDAERLGLHLTAFVSCYTSPDCAYDEFTRRLERDAGDLRGAFGCRRGDVRLQSRHPLDAASRRAARPSQSNAGNGAHAHDGRAQHALRPRRGHGSA